MHNYPSIKERDACSPFQIFAAPLAARLSLAPFAITRKPLSMPGNLASASTPTDCIANLFQFLIWTIEHAPPSQDQNVDEAIVARRLLGK